MSAERMSVVSYKGLTTYLKLSKKESFWSFVEQGREILVHSIGIGFKKAETSKMKEEIEG